MTEAEALKKAREAYLWAYHRCGEDRVAIALDIELQKAKDRSLKEAIGICGYVAAQSENDIKH